MNKELSPLEALNNLTEYLTGSYRDCFSELSIIKQALKNYEIYVKYAERMEKEQKTLTKRLKKQDEVLRIVKEKKVAVDELIRCIEKEENSLEEYNNFAGDENSLTQEEYDLLKKVLL